MFQNSPERIGFDLRFTAVCLDYVSMIIIGMLAGPILFFAGAWYEGGNEPGMLEQMERHMVELFTIAVFILAFVEALTGHTPGKYVTGIHPGRADGRRGTLKFYLARFFAKNIWLVFNLAGPFFYETTRNREIVGAFNAIQSIFFLIFTAGCFFAIGVNRLALHDKIAKSAVYRKIDLR